MGRESDRKLLSQSFSGNSDISHYGASKVLKLS